MRDCIAHGLVTEGQLPGGLNVKRRAAKLWKQAHCAKGKRANELPHDALHQVSLYAMAVNEENAAGGRVVTAPTNGAAGIIPAVLRYYAEDCRPTRSGEGRARLPADAPPRSACCASATPRSRAPKSAARAKSAWPARWPRPAWWRRWAAATSRSRTRPKSASNTTSA
jgi:hypothetical protein